MFENETRGWHGSYSQAGRSSAEKYHLVINKDKIVSGLKSKIKVKGFFTPDDDSNIRNNIEPPYVDIFAKEVASKKDKSSSPDPSEPSEPMNKRVKKQKEFIRPLYTLMTPSCTKYNPKLEYIYKRLQSGPEWEKVSGRPENINKSYYNDPGFYITHCAINPTGKVFVDMKMQTQRGPFKQTNDVRYRTDVPYSLPKANKGKKKSSKEKYMITEVNVNEKDPNITFYDYTAQTTNENTSHLRSVLPEQYNVSQDQSQKQKVNRHQKRNLQFTSLNKANTNANANANATRSNGINCPDFKKTISRAYLNYLHRDKGTFAPFFTPNYSLIQPRTITMVTYDRSVHSKAQDNKGLRGMAIEPNYTFNIDGALKKAHNKSMISAPNFANMTSRPNNNTPLPFYMQQTFDRNSFYITSAKTLKMNNYANGKFISNYDSFFPKKSFNKIINMNLLGSDKFVNNALNLDKLQTSNFDQPGITQAMKFYRKNFDDKLNEHALSSFDGVTLKSIPKKNNLDPKERKRFEINYNYE